MKLLDILKTEVDLQVNYLQFINVKHKLYKNIDFFPIFCYIVFVEKFKGALCLFHVLLIDMHKLRKACVMETFKLVSLII